MRTPPQVSHIHPLIAPHAGRIVHFNNRKLARLARLAGAPEAKAEGIYLHACLGQEIGQGQALLAIHAEWSGELAYALEYAKRSPDIIEIELAS